MGRTGLRLTANLFYQQSSLRDEQSFPAARSVFRSFDDLLPSLTLNDNLPDHRNLRLYLTTSTRPPSISQLQNVVDNSNPLALSVGNPNLKKSTNQTLVCRYSTTDVAHSRGVFVFLSVQHTHDYIGNATLTAARDTVLAGGVLMKRGTQLISPVNLNGSWNLSSFVTYSRPVGFLKSVLNLNGGVTASRTPGLIDRSENTSDTYALSQGAVLVSNISENLDFTLSYTGTFNIARNTLNPSLNTNYYSHLASLKLNVITWKGILVRDEVSNTLSNGLAGGYDQDVVLWNSGVGEKLFKNQKGELRLIAADVLNQNRSTNRTVTETYIQDTQNRTLGKYVMLTFTYTMK